MREVGIVCGATACNSISKSVVEEVVYAGYAIRESGDRTSQEIFKLKRYWRLILDLLVLQAVLESPRRFIGRRSGRNIALEFPCSPYGFLCEELKVVHLSSF